MSVYLKTTILVVPRVHLPLQCHTRAACISLHWPTVGISSQICVQRQHMGSMKLALVEVFTPWNWQMPYSHCLCFLEVANVVQHLSTHHWPPLSTHGLWCHQCRGGQIPSMVHQCLSDVTWKRHSLLPITTHWPDPATWLCLTSSCQGNVGWHVGMPWESLSLCGKVRCRERTCPLMIEHSILPHRLQGFLWKHRGRGTL